MAEVTQFMFSHKEVVTALIKQQGIHAGIWTLSVQFGMNAANIQTDATEDVIPAAIIPVLKIGIQRAELLNNLSVNAAEVNPA